MHRVPRVTTSPTGSPRDRARPIYLDNHATTPTDPRVAQVVVDCMAGIHGNASSSEHYFGDEADALVRQAGAEVASLVGTTSGHVVFTSGATEGLNLAIQGFVRQRFHLTAKKVALGVLPIDHVAVLEVCRMLARDGMASLVEFRIDRLGRLDLDHFAAACNGGLSLACVMAANNEIGTLYPLQEAVAIARTFGVAFLTDATQAVGKVPVIFDDWGLDYAIFSAHKLYGPKGIGALVIRSMGSLDPVMFGGNQQSGIRPGTLNVPGIAGFGEACRLRRLEMRADEQRIAGYRDELERLIRSGLPDVVVNGDPENRLAGNLHIAIPGIPGTALVGRLRDKVALSTGSACSSGVEGPSHVVRALGLPSELKEGCLRIGLGRFTTLADVARAADLIIECARDLRQLLHA